MSHAILREKQGGKILLCVLAASSLLATAPAHTRVRQGDEVIVRFPPAPAAAVLYGLGPAWNEALAQAKDLRRIWPMLPAPGGKRFLFQGYRGSSMVPMAFVWDDEKRTLEPWPHPPSPYEQVFDPEWSPSGRFLMAHICDEQGPGKALWYLHIQDFLTSRTYRVEVPGKTSFRSDDDILVLAPVGEARDRYLLQSIHLRADEVSPPVTLREIVLPKDRYMSVMKMFFASGRLYLVTRASPEISLQLHCAGFLGMVRLDEGDFVEIAPVYARSETEILPSPDRKRVVFIDSRDDGHTVVGDLTTATVSFSEFTSDVCCWVDNGTSLLVTTTKQPEYRFLRSEGGEPIPSADFLFYAVSVQGNPVEKSSGVPSILTTQSSP